MSANSGSEKRSAKTPMHVRAAKASRVGKRVATKNAIGTQTTKKLIVKKNERIVEINLGGRTASVAQALGSKSQLAALLNVAASQPTRWISGEEMPNAENARALIDLDHVVARARLLWSNDEVVKSWLTGHNAFLGGARPVDVITIEGTGPVIDALDQELAGGFA